MVGKQKRQQKKNSDDETEAMVDGAEDAPQPPLSETSTPPTTATPTTDGDDQTHHQQKQTQQNDKKNRKKRRKTKKSATFSRKERNTDQAQENRDDAEDVQYVSSAPMIPESSPLFEEYSRVFARFGTVEDLFLPQQQQQQQEHVDGADDADIAAIADNDEYNDDDDHKGRKNGGGGGATTAAEAAAAVAAEIAGNEAVAAAQGQKSSLSKRKRKLLSRLSIAELKQLVNRSDVVEPHDVCAPDPRLLIHIKSYRNTVAVPRHWKDKRRYLQSRRTLDKPPFQLPEFIAHTGIQKIRDSYREQEEQKKSKQKQRERMQPKQGKMDVDYQVLHDAFFKFQTKPRLSRYGDLYYEGKEYEMRMKDIARPGRISAALRQALGMPPTGSVPPPWLINMQRYGLPPSYPSLRVPGVNAPIPQGAQWGYQPGGWGRPPVDSEGKPLYGDVFNTEGTKAPNEFDQPIETGHWGELEPDEEVEEEEEEEQVEEQARPVDQGLGLAPSVMGPVTSLTDGTLSVVSTASGISSVPVTGIETPEVMGIRKRRYPMD